MTVYEAGQDRRFAEIFMACVRILANDVFASTDRRYSSAVNRDCAAIDRFRRNWHHIVGGEYFHLGRDRNCPSQPLASWARYLSRIDETYAFVEDMPIRAMKSASDICR